MSNKLKEVVKAINDMNAEIDALKHIHNEKMKEKFTEVTSAFFEAVPEVQVVVWEQYTPYFNDGDTCTFRVGYPVFVKSGYDETCRLGPGEYEYADVSENISCVINIISKPDFEYIEKELIECKKNGRNDMISYYEKDIKAYEKQTPRDKIVYEICQEFSKIICGNDDLMLDLFGDHATIYLSKDNVIIDDFDHD